MLLTVHHYAMNGGQFLKSIKIAHLTASIALRNITLILLCIIRWLHWVTYDYTGLHMVTISYMWLHWVTYGFTGLHMVTVGYSELHMVTVGYTYVVTSGITILNNIITQIRLSTAQASSFYPWLDTHTSMSITPTFITEALHLVTCLQLF